MASIEDAKLLQELIDGSKYTDFRGEERMLIASTENDDSGRVIPQETVIIWSPLLSKDVDSEYLKALLKGYPTKGVIMHEKFTDGRLSNKARIKFVKS